MVLNMWQPQSEDEILTALSNGSLEETVTFEAKSEIPAKNSELAKDVAAIANTSGGVIVFGIREDSNKRLTIATPFDLKGQRERIDQIIQTSISEIPTYKLRAIETAGDPSKGYIILKIEPSERAPHMVEVKGEQRYYGRSETGNRVLTEIEVARLYERRQLTRSDALALLNKLIAADPLKEEVGYIHLHILVKPVLAKSSLLEEVQKSTRKETGFDYFIPHILDAALKTAIKPKLFNDDEYYFGLSTPPRWEPRIDGYFTDVFRYGYDRAPESSETLQLQVNFDGSGTLFCGWMGQTIEKSNSASKKYFYRARTAVMTARFITFWGEIYKRAEYLGKVDVGLALTNLEGSIDSETSDIDIRPNSGFYAPDYKQTMRIPAFDLKANPKRVAEDLLTRLFESIAPTKKNMFKLGEWK